MNICIDRNMRRGGLKKKNNKNKTFCTLLLYNADNVSIFFFFYEYNECNSIWQKLTLIRLIFLTVSIKLET